MGTLVPLCVLSTIIYTISAQNYFSGINPAYLQSRYGNRGIFGTSNPDGVKTVNTKTFTKNTKTGGGGSYMTKSSHSSSETLINGGRIQHGGGIDTGFPQKFGLPTCQGNIVNARISCVNVDCEANCFANHQFSDGKTSVQLACVNGEWVDKFTGSPVLGMCDPICEPACQNNGICIGVNHCNCPENFSGDYCQYYNKPCLNFPPYPISAHVECNDKICIIECKNGTKFPDGSMITQMKCEDGIWVPSKQEWTEIPECRYDTCMPPCLNGATCMLENNFCSCPAGYTGYRCEFQAKFAACDVNRPNEPHESDCHKFYQCNFIMNGRVEKVGKTCGESMYYNPQTMICDWPDNVIKIRPECGGASGAMTGFNIDGHYLKPIVWQQSYNYSSPGKVGFFMNRSESHWAGQDQYNENVLPPIPNAPYGIPPTSGQKILVDVFPSQSQVSYFPSPTPVQVIQPVVPKPSSCFTWGGRHYKTFDGQVFSFESKCSHLLVSDVDSMFSIHVQNSPVCLSTPRFCHRIIKIYYQGKEYVLKQSDDGKPVFATTQKLLPLPTLLPGLRAEFSAHYLVISLDSVGLILRWDGEILLRQLFRTS